MNAQVMSCSVCATRNRVPAIAQGKPQCQSCHTPLPWIVSATEENFDQVADSSRLPVLIDLWAPWCGPCRQMGPVVEQIARENAGRLKLVKVNVDQAPTIARRFDAQSIPTFVMLSRGRRIGRQVGGLQRNQFHRWVNGLIGGRQS